VKLNRRGFLLGSAALSLGTCGAMSATSQRALPPPPPGSGSVKDLLSRCTGCNLCIARCPSNVLKAADFEYGLAGVMMPRMDFSHGFCRPDCTACGDVCPAGAIRPFTTAEKKGLRQAVAVCDSSACLVTREGLACGNCAEHCPEKAISMVKDADGKCRPRVNGALCSGCGACEYHCPTKALKVVARADGEVTA